VTEHEQSIDQRDVTIAALGATVQVILRELAKLKYDDDGDQNRYLALLRRALVEATEKVFIEPREDTAEKEPFVRLQDEFDKLFSMVDDDKLYDTDN